MRDLHDRAEQHHQLLTDFEKPLLAKEEELFQDRERHTEDWLIVFFKGGGGGGRIR